MNLVVKVMTPGGVNWALNAEEVILPSLTGRLGILKNHVPLLTGLDIGVMSLKRKGKVNTFVLTGGVAEIKNNEVIILSKSVYEGAKLDLEIVTRKFQEASKLYQNVETDEAKQAYITQVRIQKSKFKAYDLDNKVTIE